MKQNGRQWAGLWLAAMLASACGRTVGGSVPTPTLAPTEVLEEQAVPPSPEAVPPEPETIPTIDEATLSDATALPPVVSSEGPPLIAFASAFGGEDFEIFLVEPTGQNLLQLTDNNAQDFAPAWSPDRMRLAFHSDRDGNEELYVMEADGSAQIRLTDDPAADTFPAWSPDGTRLAFVSTRGGKSDLWMVDLATAELTQLTDDADDPANPDWSPDGTRIAYTASSAGEGSVRVVAVDAPGTASDVAVGAFYPDWSPNGQMIAYAAQGESLDIFVAQPDGGVSTPLTRDPAQQHSPSFSPDGGQLVFVWSSDVTSDLWLMNLDGSGALQITQGLNPLMPRWSP